MLATVVEKHRTRVPLLLDPTSCAYPKAVPGFELRTSDMRGERVTATSPTHVGFTRKCSRLSDEIDVPVRGNVQDRRDNSIDHLLKEYGDVTTGQGSKALICILLTKLNIHLLLEHAFLNLPGYSSTATQMQPPTPTFTSVEWVEQEKSEQLRENQNGQRNPGPRKVRTNRMAIERLADPDVRRTYKNRLLESLPNAPPSDVNSYWDETAASLHSAGNFACGTTQPGALKHWISDRTVALLKSRRNIPAGPEHNPDGDHVILTLPGWRHYKIWLPTDVSGVLVVSFYPDFLSECLEIALPQSLKVTPSVAPAKKTVKLHNNRLDSFIFCQVFATGLFIRKHQPHCYRLVDREAKIPYESCLQKLNIHLLLEHVFLKFPGYYLTVTQMQASATRRLHKFRNRSHFLRDTKRSYDKHITRMPHQ
ncbi:hypothetical protein T265_11334 [Opisthorchis viverrini]|uniref:Uncharacterized protein n=1 Tax=Opisthorchis viverrini TaxID=6198 RepID=A0A074YZD3_OPIVI|nr:hypothetical protein T265_11334 [Opisthorchis viverrini]KER20033.1 hypothetical protein T265_11334 [Opisthorchis viverrini]